jgi:hypothetical protein
MKGKRSRELVHHQDLIQSSVPTAISDLLADPPLLSNEDPDQYRALVHEFARAVNPNDVIEWLWLKDVADLTWDILRYRRIKAAYIDLRFERNLLDRLMHLKEAKRSDLQGPPHRSPDDDDKINSRAEALVNQWFHKR